MHHYIQYRQLLLTAIIGLFFLKTNAQDLTNDFKTWYGVNANIDLNSDFRIKAGAILSLNTAPTDYSFSQGKIGLSYKIKRRMYVEGGYSRLLLNYTTARQEEFDLEPGLFNKLAFDRAYLNYSFRHDLVNRLSLRHKLEGQYFFPAVEKHQSRLVLVQRLSYNIRRTSVSPYIEQQLFYYAGGEIPNGVRRFRIKTGLRFNLIDDFPMTTSIYFMMQNEMNTNPLPENDYNVFGISASFSL